MFFFFFFLIILYICFFLSATVMTVIWKLVLIAAEVLAQSVDGHLDPRIVIFSMPNTKYGTTRKVWMLVVDDISDMCYL